MVKMELTDEEARIVQNVLENYLSHLEVEVHRTEKREFKEALKEREKFLHDFIERLKKLRG